MQVMVYIVVDAKRTIIARQRGVAAGFCFLPLYTYNHVVIKRELSEIH